MEKFVILNQPELGLIAISTNAITAIEYIQQTKDGMYEFLVYFADDVSSVMIDLGDDVMDAATALECFVDFLRDQGK